MSTEQGNTTVSAENRNADVIAGLREAADWLEAHPDLPALTAHLYKFIYRSDREDAREALTAIAQALPDATESADSRNVVIRGTIGVVTVRASAEVKLLGEAPPTPRYEPIIDPQRDDRELTW